MRWRYRDEVSPIMAAGARVLADVALMTPLAPLLAALVSRR